MLCNQENLKENMATQPEKKIRSVTAKNCDEAIVIQRLVQILTSHAIQCFSLKPMARAPLETRGIQKVLTQLNGSTIDHLVKI